MKTQVIQLDPHDDVISIRDKMSWAKTDRILLVFPRRVNLRLRNLDLRLLRRHATALGAELAFVSRSNTLRRLAREEGIPFYRVTSRAQRKMWETLPVPEMPGRQAPPADLWGMRREVYADRDSWQNLPAVRFSFFALAVLTVLALLILFLPSAVVHLSPQTKPQTLSIPLSASLTETTVNLAGTLPARTQSMFVERTRVVPVTTTKAVPDSAAAGKIRFRNLTNTEIAIPAGTVVRTVGTPPIRFTTSEAATVQGSVGKTVDVPVKAIQAGVSGNLPADSLTAMEGDLGASLAVTNPARLTGGTNRTVRLPSAADRERLAETIQKDILAECEGAFVKSAGAGSLIFPASLKISQVVSSTYIPADGQPGETLSLTLNAQCEVEYASNADMTRLAQMGMDVNLPAGYESLPESAIAIAASQPKIDPDGTAHWTMRAERLLQARLDPAAAIQLIQGRRPSSAVKKLEDSLPLGASPEIRLTPSWWPWLPVFPFRISVSSGQE